MRGLRPRIGQRSGLISALGLACGLLGLLLFSAQGPRLARADRLERLTQLLKKDPSYKVRLQVAITLGKLRDPRAVPALIAALGDPHRIVRGAAAAALGQIGDKRAIEPLRETIAQTSDSFVSSQARQALAALDQAGQAPADARFFVTVGKISNTSVKGGKRLSDTLAKALLRQFSKVPGVATQWGGRQPSPSELSKRRVKAYVLDGAIVSLSQREAGNDLEISCSIRVSLTTYPNNSMKAFYTGGASVAVPARSFKAAIEDQIYAELIEGAAEGAREHIVQAYLRNE